MAKGLEGLRVVEAGGPIAAPLAAKFMADLGATVLKIEPPEGDPARRRGPFRDDKADPEASGLFLALNTSKRSLVLDLRESAGQTTLEGLLENADLFIHDFSPPEMALRGLDFARYSARNPRLVMVSITPFGLTGPYRDFRAVDLNLIHAGGWGWVFPGVPADMTKPPIKPFGHQALIQAGIHGATAALAACYGATWSGRGEHVDLSIQEVLASFLGRHLHCYIYSGRVESRLPHKISSPSACFPCRDGAVFILCPEQDQWWRLVEMMGNPEWAVPEEFDSPTARGERTEIINSKLSEWTATWEAEALFKACQERRIPAAPVLTFDRIAEQEHLRARGFFVEHDHPVAGKVTLTGPSFRFRDRWWALRSPAPRLGEANAQEELGFRAHEKNAYQGERETTGKRDRSRGLPLSGVRVLDLTWVWAGPQCTQILAFLGAEVNKIEWAKRLDLARRLPPFRPGEEGNVNRSGYFNHLGQSKRSVAINLAKPEGIALVKRLAGVSDVVVSNFGFGVMERLGLSAEEFHAINPELIVVRISAFGQDGPIKHYTGYGPAMLPISGMTALTGYELATRQDVGIAYADPNAGAHTALSIAAALLARRRNGGGQDIDVSLWEAMIASAFEGWVSFAMGHNITEPLGNRDPVIAPHGCYRCAGEEAWVSVAATSDGEWRALCAEMGRPELAEEPRFRDNAARKANEEDLDRLIGEWCAGQERWALTRRLQAAGVPAFPSLNAKDVAEDPHLADRKFLGVAEHPEVGRMTHAGVPWRLANGGNEVPAPAPLLGQHTEEVLGGLLGIEPGELQKLRAQGVLE